MKTSANVRNVHVNSSGTFTATQKAGCQLIYTYNAVGWLGNIREGPAHKYSLYLVKKDGFLYGDAERDGWSAFFKNPYQQRALEHNTYWSLLWFLENECLNFNTFSDTNYIFEILYKFEKNQQDMRLHSKHWKLNFKGTNLYKWSTLVSLSLTALLHW